MCLETKCCPKCKGILPVSDFAKNSQRVSGLQDYCRKCTTDYHKKYLALPFKATVCVNLIKERGGEKFCFKCERFLSLGDFFNDRTTKSGKSAYCKE